MKTHSTGDTVNTVPVLKPVRMSLIDPWFVMPLPKAPCLYPAEWRPQKKKSFMRAHTKAADFELGEEPCILNKLS